MPAFNNKSARGSPCSHRIRVLSVTPRVVLPPSPGWRFWSARAPLRRWREEKDLPANDCLARGNGCEPSVTRFRQRYFSDRRRRCRASPIHCSADIPGAFNEPRRAAAVGERRTGEENCHGHSNQLFTFIHAPPLRPAHERTLRNSNLKPALALPGISTRGGRSYIIGRLSAEPSTEFILQPCGVTVEGRRLPPGTVFPATPARTAASFTTKS